MDMQKGRSAKVTGWISVAFSIALLMVFIFKSAAGRGASPALLVIGLALLVTGIICFATSNKLSRE